MEDKLEWHDSMGNPKQFSVREVWNSIRPRSDVVDWYNVVWFPNCIPSHAFHLWLVAKRRLKTQDRLRPWDIIGNTISMCCPLCDGPPDSHDHLFYDCPYSTRVWNDVKLLVGLANVTESSKSDEKESVDYEQENEELRIWLIVVLDDEEETVNPEILSTKNTSYHKPLSSMLREFNRQDLVDLHKLVMKRFEDNTLEGYNLLLWGDLKARTLLLVGTMMMWMLVLYIKIPKLFILVFGLKPIGRSSFALSPWCLLGDFNASLYVDDTFIGPSSLDITMREFKECVETMEVMDDRFVGAHAMFKPYRISDHSPLVLSIPSLVMVKPKPFKFFNIAILDKKFKDVVREGWIHTNVIRLREKLDRLQADLDNDPSNVNVREEEAATVVAFNEAILLEEKFLKQKAKITWLREGDANTAYFHKMVRSRVSRSRIDVLRLISDANEALDMVRVVSSQEVKSAMFSMGNDKSLGPDGFTAAFFKDAWDIIGSDVTKAVSFVPRRSISDNILLTQAIMHNYHLDRGVPRCAFKVDTQKAYDTVNWVRESSNFTYHRYCSDLDLINLCFADDLFLFAHGDVNSASIIKEALDEFKDASGLNPSMPKSKAYFYNVLNHTKLAILHVLPFEEDRLRVKYLGVPLVSSRLIFRDCKELIDKVQNRVNDWKNKSLSIVGRLQLSNLFWDILMSFGLRISRGKAKVAWEVVCLPKKEGGLGIRRLDHFNKALMFDRWCVVSPLGNIISARDIARSGFSLTSKVRECIHGGMWSWPNDWLVKYPILSSIHVPVLNDAKLDVLE
nr:reverse transcriptase domain-containing protein [Tanacetum cinerariifolium]